MKLKNLFIAAVLVVGIGYFIFNHNERSFKGQNRDDLQEVLSDLDLTKVNSIRIHSPEGSVTLKRVDSIWTVEDRGNYPADFEKVGSLAKTFDDLKILSEELVGPSQMARLELLAPDSAEGTGQGTDVAFLDQDGKEISRIRIGKGIERDNPPANNNPTGMSPANNAGKFVKRLSDDKIFIVSEAFDTVDFEPASWLNKTDFFKVQKASKISVKSDVPEQNWTLARATESDSWTLEDLKEDEKISSSAVGSFNSFLNFASFNDVATNQELMKDPKTITVETFDGFKYTIQVGGKTDNGLYPMTVNVDGLFPTERTPEEGESEEDKKSRDDAFAAELKPRQDKLTSEQKLHGAIFLVNTWTLDSALKNRDEFLEKEEESTTTSGEGESIPETLLRPDNINYPEIPSIIEDQAKKADDVIQDALKGISDKASDVIEVPVISETVNQASESVKEKVTDAADAVEEKVNEAVEAVEKKIEKVIPPSGEGNPVNDAIEKIEESIDKAAEVVPLPETSTPKSKSKLDQVIHDVTSEADDILESQEDKDAVKDALDQVLGND